MIDGHIINTHVFHKFFDDIINDNYVSSKHYVDDVLNGNHQNVKAKVLSKTSDENNGFNKEVSNKDSPGENDKIKNERNVAKNENDNILIAHTILILIKIWLRLMKKWKLIKNLLRKDWRGLWLMK